MVSNGSSSCKELRNLLNCNILVSVSLLWKTNSGTLSAKHINQDFFSLEMVHFSDY